MYPQPAQPVDREIQGMLVGMEPRQGGWHRFAIMEPGNQHPTRVDTKKQDVIQQALGLMGQQVAAAVREQPSDPTKINPNSGRPYGPNRWLNGIAPFGFAPGVAPAPGAVSPQTQQQYVPQQPAPQVPQPSPQPQVAPGLMGHEKDVSIWRQTASKVVAMHWQMLPEEQRNLPGLIEAAEAWMAYYIHGPLRFGVTAFGDAPPTQTQNGPDPASGNWYSPGQPHFIELTGQFPCPECGHSDQHAEGCPAGIPA